MRAPSRVNPLPQVQRPVRGLRCTCGSGFTREEATTGCHLPRCIHAAPSPLRQITEIPTRLRVSGTWL
ncbi:hypothetical protein CMV24_16785 [Pseudomonas plecoglossicida]|uniref:Uncharacterized protein n=1 Tax=Pseudomonas plecoglossicida TaxID=70775 RepID=A0A2A3M2W1_PSEDL|nr:hypothetical protein CMV24_16785 [Pseudomonas plecoglossicida]